MNKVILIGNLTRDPELNTTTSGISVARFTIAVQRKYKDESGVAQADFINCVAWRWLAEHVAKYLAKGRKCAVIGEIQTRTYDGQDGTKKYVTEVVANEVEFLGGRVGGDEPEMPAPKDEVNTLQPVEDDSLPF